MLRRCCRSKRATPSAAPAGWPSLSSLLLAQSGQAAAQAGQTARKTTGQPRTAKARQAAAAETGQTSGQRARQTLAEAGGLRLLLQRLELLGVHLGEIGHRAARHHAA